MNKNIVSDNIFLTCENMSSRFVLEFLKVTFGGGGQMTELVLS